MAIPAAAIAKAAIGVLSNEKTRKAAGWVLVAILSPIILLIAAFCSILGGSADHNSSILDLCFYGGTLPADIPAEYRAYIEDMQASFTLLDERIAEINTVLLLEQRAGYPVPKCRLSVRMDFVLQWAPAGKVESHQSLDTDPIPLPARQKVIPVSTSLCPQAHQFVQLCPESLQRQPTMLVAMATM